MSVLYLICDLDGVVFTFTSADAEIWQFSRLSQFHHDNGKDHFVLRQASEGNTSRWVLENQSGQATIFGTPKYSGNGPPFRGKPSPPRGMWTVWGCPFVLSDTMPQKDAIPSPFTFEVPFAKMHFREEGRLGYLDIDVFNAAIEDESLDEILQALRKVLVNLAQRPEMVLLLRTDARSAPMPSMRHVRKFLAFIQKEVGTECVLVGRGSAIVLVPSTFLGMAVLRLVQLVQRMLPAPYPQAIVASLEEADEFLKNIAQETTACAPIPWEAAASPRPLQEYMRTKTEEVESEVVDLRNHEVETRPLPLNQAMAPEFKGESHPAMSASASSKRTASPSRLSGSSSKRLRGQVSRQPEEEPEDVIFVVDEWEEMEPMVPCERCGAMVAFSESALAAHMAICEAAVEVPSEDITCDQCGEIVAFSNFSEHCKKHSASDFSGQEVACEVCGVLKLGVQFKKWGMVLLNLVQLEATGSLM
eukprot:symbB.v1.2.031860.t1/scaffold3580.1/size53821/4